VIATTQMYFFASQPKSGNRSFGNYNDPVMREEDDENQTMHDYDYCDS